LENRVVLSCPGLPAEPGVAVIGGRVITDEACQMAALIGKAIILAGRSLLTGGRRGAGEHASLGAAVACSELGTAPEAKIFALVPRGERSDFRIGTCLEAGSNWLERRILLIRHSVGAIVVGGGEGTADEVRIAVLQAIMEGYSIIPASGTGGIADRICCAIKPFDEPVLNDPRPSEEKARRLVRKLLARCWYCDIDPVVAHDDWFFRDKRDPTAARMARLRRTYF
jgi:hypothetical protein